MKVAKVIMTSAATTNARQEQLLVAISGMVGRDMAGKSMSKIRLAVADKLTGAAHQRATRYVEELSRIGKQQKSVGATSSDWDDPANIIEI